jgi:hypothetical protein
MPFTPFHFGPSGLAGLVFRKWVDLPVFVLANVVIDLEPLTVLAFGLDYPMHGLCHTFLLGGALGLAWGAAAYPARGLFKSLMGLFGLPYQTNLPKMFIAGLLGVWFHVLLDAFCWQDVRPFWPLQANPLLDVLSVGTVYLLCTVCFVPAIALYIILAVSRAKKNMAVRGSEQAR